MIAEWCKIVIAATGSICERINDINQFAADRIGWVFVL